MIGTQAIGCDSKPDQFLIVSNWSLAQLPNLDKKAPCVLYNGNQYCMEADVTLYFSHRMNRAGKEIIQFKSCFLANLPYRQVMQAFTNQNFRLLILCNKLSSRAREFHVFHFLLHADRSF